MRTVGAYEAKTYLPSLLDEVEAGEIITITRHGVPVAKLVPAREVSRERIREAVAALKQFSHGRELRGLTIRELIEEGRRF